MKGIATVYRSCDFRSRVEARWAAFFDLVEWRWIYEPFDLPGWIPDFSLAGKPRDVLVEVKCFSDFNEFGPTIKKIENAIQTARCECDVLLLGSWIRHGKFCNNDICLGWLGENFAELEAEDQDPDRGGDVLCFGDAIFVRGEENWDVGICHEYQSFADRISGSYYGGSQMFPEFFDAERLMRVANSRTKWASSRL